jgi:hypothetical protein
MSVPRRWTLPFQMLRRTDWTWLYPAPACDLGPPPRDPPPLPELRPLALCWTLPFQIAGALAVYFCIASLQIPGAPDADGAWFFAFCGFTLLRPTIALLVRAPSQLAWRAFQFGLFFMTVFELEVAWGPGAQKVGAAIAIISGFVTFGTTLIVMGLQSLWQRWFIAAQARREPGAAAPVLPQTVLRPSRRLSLPDPHIAAPIVRTEATRRNARGQFIAR